jgi:hypothetical protein
MEVMGYRAAISAGTEMQALATFTKTSKEFMKNNMGGGLKNALQKRDEKFGDYRAEGGKGAADKVDGPKARL